jgi:hypothetical protein
MPPNSQFPFQSPTAPVASGIPVAPTAIATPAPIGSAPSPQPTTAPTPKNPNSTQNTLLLSEIRDNIVIMADGTFRAVVAANAKVLNLVIKTS